MHPSAVLLCWLFALLLTQSLGAGLLLVSAVLLLALRPAVWQPWLSYLRRSRWLLLSVWLILAYHTPGDALWDQPWAPTEQGALEASLHAARLALMLGWLAWLFDQLGRDGLVAALWGLSLPARGSGGRGERFVVRLALVLDHLRTRHAADDWRRILRGEPPPLEGRGFIRLELPLWRVQDTSICLLVALLCGVIMGVGG